MAKEPILITNFDGQAENPHIGAGVNVGLDLYTTKNVARLSRKMQKKSASLATGLPLFATQDNNGNIYSQLDNGTILKSTDDGNTWTVLAGNTGTDGKGLTVWQDYLWAFFQTGVDLYGPLSGVSAWINTWNGFTGGNALTNQVGVNHFPFPNPAIGNVMYVNNGNSDASTGTRTGIAQVEILTFPFNPAGVPGTDYEVTVNKFNLSSNYIPLVMGFLPTSSIAIGAQNRTNPSQADIIIWDGVADTSATNVFTIPGATGPVTNLVTRNGIVYATTTNEAGIYTVNGTSSEIVDRLGLRMTNRTANGVQYTTRVQPTVRVGSADFLGPEMLVGICNQQNPMSQPAGVGLYPYGVWGVNIEGPNVYTKFPLSHGDINADYNVFYEIGFVKVIEDGRVLVGWGKGNTFGIDALSPSDYITDEATVFVESELFEVGTRIQPETFNKLQYNLVEQLQGTEELQFYYRLSQGDPYTLFKTDTVATLGTNLGGVITPLPFQKAKYIQIGVKIKAGSGTPTHTPQLVSIYLT